MQRARQKWRTGAIALALLALLVVAVARLPLGIPPSVLFQGVIVGCLSGLTAIGLVMVHRSTRVINFVHAEFGALGSTLAFNLMVVSRWPWAAAVAFSIAVVAAVGALLELVVIRRLAKGPRLMATVATLGLAQVITFVTLFVASTFAAFDYEAITDFGAPKFPTPFGGPAFRLGSYVFSWNHVLVLVVSVPLFAAVGWFYLRSRAGIAIRAASENGERAALLGTRVPRLGTLAWTMAAALSAVAAVLQAPVTSFSPFTATAIAGSMTVFARALAAAVIGRLENVTVTIVAALAIGIGEQVYYYNYQRSAPLDGLLLLAVLMALLIQRGTVSRSAWTDSSTWQYVTQVRSARAQIRQLPNRMRVVLKLPIFVVFVAALIIPLQLGLEHTRLATTIYVYAIVAVSLVVLCGWAGQVSLGQWSLSGVGAFVAGRWAPELGLDLALTFVLAGSAGALVAIAIGIPALRLRGLFLSATTIIFAVACASWVFDFGWLQPKGRLERPRFLGIDLRSETRYHYLILGMLALTLIAARNVRTSSIGRALVAQRDNEAAAQAYGISPAMMKVRAFGFSGFLAAFAGSCYAFLVQTVNNAQWDAFTSLSLLSMVVIGGVTSLTGAVIGAAYVYGAMYLLPEDFAFLATGSGLVLLILLLPGGLSHLVFTARDSVLRRLGRVPPREVLAPSQSVDSIECLGSPT